MLRCVSGMLLLGATIAGAQPPQAGTNFLQEAFGRQPLNVNPLLSAEFPRVALLFANRAVQVEGTHGGDEATVRAPGSEAVMVARVEHQGAFDICRISHQPGSPIPPDELKLVWGFPMEFNESMTLDAGALAGHPLYLPDGTVPPAHFVNWGTLFYNRAANLAIGTVLAGAAPAAKHWGRRTGPTGPTQLHFWTSMGRADLEVTIFAYRPGDQRLWWAEWYQDRERRAPGAYPHMFPVLSPLESSWMPGEQQEVQIVPAGGPG